MIERKFSVGKRRYGMDCIVTKLQKISEVSIHVSVLFHEPAEEAPASFAPFFQMAVLGPSKRLRVYELCTRMSQETCAGETNYFRKFTYSLLPLLIPFSPP